MWQFIQDQIEIDHQGTVVHPLTQYPEREGSNPYNSIGRDKIRLKSSCGGILR
jgi:hypothetical protein